MSKRSEHCPASEFDGYEVWPCVLLNEKNSPVKYNDPNGRFFETAPTHDDPAIVCWTVYQHFNGRGLVAVGDYLSSKQAWLAIDRRLRRLRAIVAASGAQAAQWTEEHQKRAFGQGWGVFSIDGDDSRLEIQRLDEAYMFDSDEDAYAYVIDIAREGDETAVLALQICPPF